MPNRIDFRQEITNLLHAVDGASLRNCMQCGTCSAVCPAAPFMDYSPRALIELIASDLKPEVLASNAYWTCASCYLCTARCPRGINVAELMYGLKRYSLWKNRYQRGLLGPGFSKRFVKMILRTGKSFEPSLAPAYVLRYGVRGFLNEALMALRLLWLGRMPMRPHRIKRIANFRRMVSRIVPIPGAT